MSLTFITLTRNRLKFWSVVLSGLLLASACDNSPIDHIAIGEDYQRPVDGNLYQTENDLRRATLKNLNYEINLDLTNDRRYKGFVEIRFDYRETPYPLTIDFKQGEIERIWINNGVVPIDYNGYFISIPSTQLREGGNRIKIQFSQNYSYGSPGLNRYFDNRESNYYVYLMSAPYESNRLFPSFDQFNLQASFISRIVVDNDWQVFTAVTPSKVTDKGEYKLFLFEDPQNKPLDNYNLIAGNWSNWQGKAAGTDIKLFMRSAIKQQQPVRQWFKALSENLKSTKAHFPALGDLNNINLFLVPGSFGYQSHHANLLLINEQQLINQPNATDILSKQLIYQQLAAQFGGIDWHARWFQPWLVEKISKWSRSPTQPIYSTLPQYVDLQPESTLIGSFNSSADPRIHDYDLKHIKAVQLLDGLQSLLTDEQLKRAINHYLSGGKAGFQALLEALQSQTNKDLSLWTNQWLAVAGQVRLSINRICDKEQLNAIQLIQEVPKDIPLIRTLHINLLVSGAKQLPPIEMNTRQTQVALDGLDCHTAILLKAEPYVVIETTNHFDSAYKMLGLNPNITVFELLATVQATPKPSKETIKQWLAIITESLSQTKAPWSASEIELLKQRIIKPAVSNDWHKLLQPLEQRLYNLSHNTAIDLSLRSQWLAAYLQIARTQHALDVIFTWLAGAAPPEDLLPNESLIALALIHLQQQEYDKASLLVDQYRANDPFKQKAWHSIIDFMSASPEAKHDYLEQLIANKETYPDKYMLQLITASQYLPTEALFQWLTVSQSTLPLLEKRMGTVLFNRWLSRILQRPCSSQIVNLLNSTELLETLSEASRDRLKQVPQTNRAWCPKL